MEKVLLCYRCKTRHMLGENFPEATPTTEDSGMSFIEQSDTPRENSAPVQLKSSVDTQLSAESLRTFSPTRGGGGDGEQGSLSTGGSSSDSVTGLGSGSSDENEYVLESPDGPNILSEKPPGLPSQEDLSVIQRVQVNPEPNSLGIESNLPLKGNQNINEPASNDSVKKGQLVSKRKILKSLRNFPYELINYS